MISCIGASLNGFTRKRDLERIFRRTRTHLKQEGVFVFDVNTLRSFRTFLNLTRTVREDHRTTIIETSYDRRSALGHWVITGFVEKEQRRQNFTQQLTQRAYRTADIERLLRRLCFRFSKYDSDRQSKSRRNSLRLLYVCRRT